MSERKQIERRLQDAESALIWMKWAYPTTNDPFVERWIRKYERKVEKLKSALDGTKTQSAGRPLEV
ncbi:MAG: hypothetical protein ACK4S4_15980 [Pyrinomonadaceae bacterium]